jgi:hypothetical protein
LSRRAENVHQHASASDLIEIHEPTDLAGERTIEEPNIIALPPIRAAQAMGDCRLLRNERRRRFLTRTASAATKDQV